MRQALADASLGALSPPRNRPDAFLDAQDPSISDSSPLTFDSSQYSPSSWPQVPFAFFNLPPLAEMLLCKTVQSEMKHIASSCKGPLLKNCVVQNSSLNAVRGSKAVPELLFIHTCIGNTVAARFCTPCLWVHFCLFDTDKHNCAKTTRQEVWPLPMLPGTGAPLSGCTSVHAAQHEALVGSNSSANRAH